MPVSVQPFLVRLGKSALPRFHLHADRQGLLVSVCDGVETIVCVLTNLIPNHILFANFPIHRALDCICICVNLGVEAELHEIPLVVSNQLIHRFARVWVNTLHIQVRLLVVSPEEPLFVCTRQVIGKVCLDDVVHTLKYRVFLQLILRCHMRSVPQCSQDLLGLLRLLRLEVHVIGSLHMVMLMEVAQRVERHCIEVGLQ
mmetsp:Transcript_11077/g.25368  ORF Transcript_11077/g.25368 Transcript_11077/m.25368 type:complete len:200 (+) Transcript_11077:122-721(+)